MDEINDGDIKSDEDLGTQDDIGKYYKMSAVKKVLSQAAVPNVRLLN